MTRVDEILIEESFERYLARSRQDCLTSGGLRKFRDDPCVFRHWIGRPPEPSTPEQALGSAAHCAILEPKRYRAEYVPTPQNSVTGKGYGTDSKKAQNLVELATLPPDRFDELYITELINEETGKPYGKKTKTNLEWLDTLPKGVTVISESIWSEVLEFRETLRARGWRPGQPLEVLSEYDANLIYSMRESLRSMSWYDTLFEGGVCERVARAVYCGRLCQVRPDILTPHPDGGVRLTDLKTTKRIRKFQYEIRDREYPHALALYAAVLGECGVHVRQCSLVAVEKTPPYRAGWWIISEERIEKCRKENEEAISRLLECEDDDWGEWTSKAFEKPIVYK